MWVRKVRSAATKPRTVREHAVADDYRRAHSAYRTLRERARRAVAERKRLDVDHAALLAKVDGVRELLTEVRAPRNPRPPALCWRFALCICFVWILFSSSRLHP